MASDLIKYGAIAAGGYLIYEYFFGTLFHPQSAVATNNTNAQAQTGQTTPQGAQQTAQLTILQQNCRTLQGNVNSAGICVDEHGNTINTNAPTNTGATVDINKNIQAIKAKILANAKAEGFTSDLAGYDVWNYYLQKPNGALPFEQSGITAPRDQLMSVDMFATILAQKGITGLGIIARGFSGLGYGPSGRFVWGLGGLGIVNLGQYMYENNPTALTRLGGERPFSNESKLGFEGR